METRILATTFDHEVITRQKHGCLVKPWRVTFRIRLCCLARGRCTFGTPSKTLPGFFPGNRTSSRRCPTLKALWSVMSRTACRLAYTILASHTVRSGALQRRGSGKELPYVGGKGILACYKSLGNLQPQLPVSSRLRNPALLGRFSLQYLKPNRNHMFQTNWSTARLP